VLAVLMAAGAVVAVAAQRGQVMNPLPPATQQPVPLPQFRSGVDLIHLDVSVLDRNRRPVRGLAPRDFTILENGQPQTLAVFNAVDILDPDPPKTAWLRDVAPDVRSNTDDRRERRLFLILIDDAAVQAAPHAMINVKKVAREFIDRLGPSDLAAVVFSRDNRNSQDFTTDRARLLAAVDKYALGRDTLGQDLTELYFRYSVDVIRRAVETLSKLPDRRKAIVYVGQGAPVDLAMAASPASLGIGTVTAGGDVSFNGSGSAIAQRGEMAQLRYLMEQAFLYAARSNVSVYTLDVCGLRVGDAQPNGGSGQGTGGGQAQTSMEVIIAAPTAPAISLACLPGLEVDYLVNVAAATGGRAVVNTNDFGPGINAIFQENASYYLLGYQSTETRQDGKFRRIEVKVDRPDVSVRTRNGYVADRAEASAKRKAELAKEPVGAALAGVLPKGDLPMQLTAVPFAIPGRKDAAVAVMLAVKQPIRETGERTTEHVDLAVGAFNTDGRQLGGTRLRADVVVRSGATGLAEYEVLARLDLKPGRYQLRTAANVGSLATSGSLYYDVDVPDFTEARVSLSGLVFTVSPAMPLAPRDGLKGVIPVVPTTQRTFHGSDRVSAFVRVYQGVKDPLVPVPLRVRLRNQEDVLVMDRREVLSTEGFAGTHSADFNIGVPVERLAPGAYLLTLESTLDQTTAKREVRFDVVK
jgi:VWFA-related protein